MLLEISKVEVKDRIRKDFGDIEELAQDIKENSLLNPITVIPIADGKYQLIAGERRLRACESLGMTSITANAISVKNAEQALRIEISENENRKEFSFTEKMNYAKRLEEIEKIKAQERMKDPMQNFAQGKTRDKVADTVGFGSGEQYRKAKYIEENADQETIKALDEGQISVHGAYKKLKQEKEHLEQQLAELKNQEPRVIEKEIEVEKVPEDYEETKRQNRELSETNRTLLEQKHKLARQLQESKSLETEIVNLEEFRQNVATFLDGMSKYTYYSEAFKALDKRKQTEFLKYVEKIDIWCSEIKQAIRGEKSEKTIIFEGGFISE